MYKVLHFLDENLEEAVLIALLSGMTIVMGVQVFSRYALGISFSWSEELTRYMFIWSGFISLSYCSKKCISIKIEQFVAIFPRRGNAIFKIINHTVELVFFIYMIPVSFSYMMSAVESGQVSPACGIPMYYIQAAPFVSFVLVAFRIAERWIIEFKVALGKPIIDPAHPERNTPDSFIESNISDNSVNSDKKILDNRIYSILKSNEEENK